MRPQADVDLALRWVRWGLNDCEIGRLTGIPRTTLREWRVNDGRASLDRLDLRRAPRVACPICATGVLNRKRYAYLLGLYLGDGCLAEHARKVFKLRISLDERYPGIIAECTDAMAHVVVGTTTRVGRVHNVGCYEINAYWKHWPCLFPQHGAGPKFKRKIELAPWQREIASAHPSLMLRGLIHSDGSRDLNWVKGKSYPRYQFANHSSDIQKIFCRACDDLGVHWTHPSWRVISISRRADVVKLDAIIGPKK